jgi:hypothetical protein
MAMPRRISTPRVMFQRMMECSEEQISEVARHGEQHQRLVANRLLESADTFRQWEGTHSQLLRQIVDAPSTAHQLQGIKRMALSMIHRKAPFEYLRDKHICGPSRHRFFQVTYGQGDFVTSMINEHRNYLSASASYICVERFCSDPTMQDIANYEQRYNSYWRANTARLLNGDRHADRSTPEEVLGQIRVDLQRHRDRVLNAAPQKADALTMEELCRPTGDTVRLQYPQPLRTRF